MKLFDKVIIAETGEVGTIVEIDLIDLDGDDIYSPYAVRFSDNRIHCYESTELILDK